MNSMLSTAGLARLSARAALIMVIGSLADEGAAIA
jgi:hypothetical protein